jgi:integrase
VYEARVAMVRDLADRLLFPLLKARLEGRFSTTRLHQAYRAGESALNDLLGDVTCERLSPLLDRYMVSNQARDKEKTATQIRRFIGYCGGEQRASTLDLTADRIASFLDSLTSAQHHRGQPVRGGTRNRYRAAISGFCSYLVRRGTIQRHPVRYDAVPKADEGEHRMPEFSATEYRLYFAALSARAPHLVPLFRLLVHTGADVGEVLTRAVRDLHLDREVARVRFRRSKTRTPERLVPYPERFVAELRGHIALHALQPGDLLFGMVKRSQVDHVHQHVRQAISRPDLRLKDFRHVCAITWRRAGADLQSIRDWLGHATINQTVVYDRFAPDDSYDAPKIARAAALLHAEHDVTPLRAVG